MRGTERDYARNQSGPPGLPFPSAATNVVQVDHALLLRLEVRVGGGLQASIIEARRLIAENHTQYSWLMPSTTASATRSAVSLAMLRVAKRQGTVGRTRQGNPSGLTALRQAERRRSATPYLGYSGPTHMRWSLITLGTWSGPLHAP